MVGVAGRSRGCVTCRLRRVKCDEGHPTCHRCSKAGRVCGGYVQNNFIEGLPRAVQMKARAATKTKKKDLPSTREHVLVVRSTPATASASKSASGTAGSAPAGATASSTQPLEFTSLSSDSGSSVSYTTAPSVRSSSTASRSTPDLDDEDEDWDVEAEYGMDDETRALLPQLEAMQASVWVPPALDLGPFQDSIILAYAVDNMLKGLRPTTGFRFTDFVPRGGPLSRDALLTSATAYFGHRHHQKEIVQLGRQRYVNVLKELNAALADPEMSRSTMVMFSVMTLTLFEFVSPSGMFGWVHHALGIERLFAHRGPHAHMSGEGLVALNQLRMTVVFACLASEKECLLTTKEWCTIPWSLDPASKPLEQYLMDIIGQFGPWMRSMTAFWRSLEPTPEQAAAVFEANQGMKQMLEQLDWWWQMFLARHRNDCWEIAMDVTGLEADAVPQLWSTVYRFSGLMVAKDFINYHATRSMALGYSRGVDAMDPQADAAELARMAAESRVAAVQACRAVDFHLEPDKDGAGALFLIFPLRIVWRTIGGSDSPEGRWMKHVARLIGRGFRGGWANMENMLFGEYEIRNGLTEVRRG